MGLEILLHRLYITDLVSTDFHFFPLPEYFQNGGTFRKKAVEEKRLQFIVRAKKKDRFKSNGKHSTLLGCGQLE